MTTVKRKPKASLPVKKEVIPAISYSLTQMYYEIDTIRLQMAMMKDPDLIDFIVPHIDMFQHKGMDKMYDKVAGGDDLAPEERKEVEAFCILANTEMGIRI